jgi:hypothetical protein
MQNKLLIIWRYAAAARKPTPFELHAADMRQRKKKDINNASQG